MSVRELFFDIGFGSDVTPLLKADQAVNRFKSKVIGVGSAADQSIGKAAKEFGKLPGSIAKADRATISFTKDVKDFVAKSQIGQQLGSVKSAIRTNLTEPLTKTAKAAKQQFQNIGGAAKTHLGSAFSTSTIQGRLAVGIFNDLKSAGSKAFDTIDRRSKKSAESMRQFSEHLKKSSEGFAKISDSSGKIGSALTTKVTLPLFGAATASFKFASDLQENMGKTEEVFKDQSDSVLEWSKSSLKNFGMARSTALDMASLYGDMGTGMGLGLEEASSMSMSLTGLAADLSSFKNVGLEQSQNALKGIFTGEGESLKNLGIVLTETNLAEYALSQGIQKKMKDMTQAEKVQLRYNYVMAMTKNAQGDFARTGGNAANQIRVFKEGIKELATGFGMVLLPTITPLIQTANEWIGKLQNMDDKQRKNILRMGLFAASMGPAFKGIQFLSKGLSFVTKGVSLFSKGMSVVKGLGAAGSIAKIGTAVSALGGSILPVIVTIGALVAAGYLLYKNWDTVKAKGIEFVSSLQMKFASFVPTVSAIWENLKIIVSALLPVFSGVLSGIGSMLGGFLNKAADVVGALLTVFQGVTDFVIGVFTGNWEQAWTGVKTIFSGIFEGIKSIFTGAINFITGGINTLIRGFNKLSVKLPGGKAAKIPEIPQFASGVDNFSGGLAIVGEQGPELLHLPKGSSVTPSRETSKMMKSNPEIRKRKEAEIIPFPKMQSIEKQAMGRNERSMRKISPVISLSSEPKQKDMYSLCAEIGQDILYELRHQTAMLAVSTLKKNEISSPSIKFSADRLREKNLSKEDAQSVSWFEQSPLVPNSYSRTSKTFAPIVNIHMNANSEPEKTADLTIHKIRELFDEWIDEADQVS